MAALKQSTAPARAAGAEASKEAVAAAYGLSASITVVFNVVLAFIKDSYAPLNTFMAHLSGHHWRTHGLADVILFFVLGWIFTSMGVPRSGLTQRSVLTIALASVLAGAALGVWFLFV